SRTRGFTPQTSDDSLAELEAEHQAEIEADERCSVAVLDSGPRPPRGLLLFEHQGKPQPQYCSHQQLYRRSDLNDVVCFRDLNRDGAFEEIRVPSLRFGGWAKIKTAPVPYEEAVDLEQTRGFRQELLYQGVAGSSLSISYREFSDNFARPAFQQDLQYTLAPSGETEIAFKGARITVLSATNTALQYKVVSGIP